MHQDLNGAQRVAFDRHVPCEIGHGLVQALETFYR
jgi:hypothetical protein